MNPRALLSGPQQQLFLVNSTPIAAVTGHQASSDQQNKVNKPPNPKSSKGQELPHCCASVSQAETIYSKTSQEERVEQSGYEVMSGILYTRFVLSEEGPRAGALDPLQGPALHRSVLHISVGLTPELETTITKFLGCCCVSNMIHWVFTFYKFIG